MASFSATVEVQLKPGISDPQGATVERSIPALGFEGITDVKIGKSIRLTIEAPDEQTAEQQVKQLCEHFLTNPILEQASITISPALVNA